MCLQRVSEAYNLRQQIIAAQIKLQSAKPEKQTPKIPKNHPTHRKRKLVSHNQQQQQPKKPYTCSECKKTFTTNFYLKVHSSTHTGHKPYICEICHKGFTMRWILRLHSRVHSGVKPYSCTTCGKTFRFASALPSHMRIHTGLKPYSCTTCDKSFTQISALKVRVIFNNTLLHRLIFRFMNALTAARSLTSVTSAAKASVESAV